MKKSFFSNMVFFDFALIVYFAVETNYDWNQSSLLHWSAVALVMIAYIFKSGGALDFNIQDYSLWMFGCLLFGERMQ